jgi:HD-like signal output (HDOD) protein
MPRGSGAPSNPMARNFARKRCDEAVNRVGYGQVYELVSYAVASQVLVRPLEVYAMEADDLWKQSVACALAAEALAERSGQDRDVAYTVGLLHCLGMVAIDDWSARNRPGWRLRTAGYPREATESERAVFGFTQADAGAALLNHWAFPHSMCEPVRWQYSPRASAGHTRMACLLHCAKWIRCAVGHGRGARPALPTESAMQMLPLRAGDLPDIVTEVEQRLQHVSSLLDVGQLELRREMRFPAVVWDGRS